MTANAKQLTQHDLQGVIDRRKNGDAWAVIANDLGMPDSTLRGRLRVAGLLTRGARRGHNRKPSPTASTASTAAAVAAAAPVVPTPSDSFVEPGWFPLLKYAMGSEKGATLFGPRGCGKSTAIRHLAAELGRPTITMQCAANMQIDSLLGSWTSEAGSPSSLSMGRWRKPFGQVPGCWPRKRT